jgi:hypothetical protein
MKGKLMLDKIAREKEDEPSKFIRFPPLGHEFEAFGKKWRVSYINEGKRRITLEPIWETKADDIPGARVVEPD